MPRQLRLPGGRRRERGFVDLAHVVGLGDDIDRIDLTDLVVGDWRGDCGDQRHELDHGDGDERRHHGRLLP